MRVADALGIGVDQLLGRGELADGNAPGEPFGP
jgi:hypothetical protein